MTYVPITPFGRTVDAGMLSHISQTAEASLPPEGVNKWEVLRELGAARGSLGITDRELTVLQALLSFHPRTILGGNEPDLIVFPSNASICERLNGMPCSTMRRHLAGLVRSGLILRRDSPNGKRYARRFSGETESFGFDLTPLVARFAEFCDLAEEVRAEQEAHARLRQRVSLMRRDLAGLALYGADAAPHAADWSLMAALAADVARALRRKTTTIELEAWETDLAAALDRCRDSLQIEAENMSTNDAVIEHHYQNSKTNHHESEPCLEKAMGQSSEDNGPDELDPEDRNLPNIPLGLVLATCEEFRTYVPDRIRHWHNLVQAAEVIRPMIGISPSAWAEATEAMGPEEAAVVVLAMLERTSEIRSPGGYLRHLTAKATRGEFSCGPMIMALLRREEAA